jgi:hypothetical protein
LRLLKSDTRVFFALCQADPAINDDCDLFSLLFNAPLPVSFRSWQ